MLRREERRVPRSPVSSEVGDPRLLERVEKGRADKARKGGVPSGFTFSFRFSKVRRAGNLSMPLGQGRY